MSILDFVRNSKLMRSPLLATCKLVLAPLKSGPGILRRAIYDALPIPYLVAGSRELFVVSSNDKVIGREVFLHGEYDFRKLQSALAILKRERLPCPAHLIDVGANIGTIVIPALKRGLMQSGTAIEPHPDNLRLLRANLALNDVSHRVDVLAFAVGDKSGNTLNLAESATNSGNHSIGQRGIPVTSMRLDDLKIPTCDALLWMDIEGYEGHALKGAENLLSTGVFIVCEYNPMYLIQSSGMTMFQQSLNNHRIFDLKDERLPETTFDVLSERYGAGPEYTDILAIPAGIIPQI